MKRIRDVAARSALVMAALTVALSGCSELSPAVTATPYPASDGANADLPGSKVALRDFLVIGAEKGSPAVVVGAVVNNGPAEVEVALQADLGETTPPTQTVVRVGPNSIVKIGPDRDYDMLIPQLPVIPGATTQFSVATAAGGKAELAVPVLRPELAYATLTPPPTTAAPTPAETTTPSPTTKKKSKASSKDAEATPSSTDN